MTIVHGTINALHKYHPYRINGNINPKFDDLSGKILDLKEAKAEAIEKFANELAAIIPQGVVICAVPPSSVGDCSNSGIGKIVAKLCADSTRTSGVSCLNRHTKIAKLAHGGARDRQVHKDSIEVKNSDMLKGKVVYLLDDIVTTGNSIEECKQKLKDSGASEVRTYTIGYTCYE